MKVIFFSASVEKHSYFLSRFAGFMKGMVIIMAKTYSKNNWALFLMIIVGIVLGSFIGHLSKDVKFLTWLNYGIDFAIGDKNANNIVKVDLAVIVIQFGLQIKITVGSVIGAAAAILIYRKLK